MSRLLYSDDLPADQDKEPLPPASVAKSVTDAQALVKASKFAAAISSLAEHTAPPNP